MAIIIDALVKPIEFVINGEEFEAKKDDKLLKEVANYALEARDEIQKLDADTATSTELDFAREKIIKGTDTLLGEGAFAKIEKTLANDDKEYTLTMGEIFFQIFDEYGKELQVKNSKYSREDE